MCYNHEKPMERGWKMERKRCIIPVVFPRRFWIPALLSALLLAGAAVFLLTRGDDGTVKPGDALLTASQGLTEYRATLRMDPEAGTLAISETVDYVNATGESLNDLSLRLWINAFKKEETSPASLEEIYDACYFAGFSPGGMTVYDVLWNGERVDFAFSNEDETALRFAIPTLLPGERGTLLFRGVAQIPQCAYRTGRTEGIWQLGNVIPLMAHWENGEWRQDAYAPIGDPFVSDCANFDLSVYVPEGWTPACSAPLKKKADGLWQGTILAARDAALCLYENGKTAKARLGDTLILSYAAGEEEARAALKYGKKALETFSSLYGPYPYPVYTLCQTDFPFGGMEYPALSMIGKSLYAGDKRETLELTVAHETAHQWFYALVGSDQALSPWQDEALCEYAMLRYVQKRYGQSSFDTLKYYRADAPMAEGVSGSLTPGSPISYFSNFTDYRTVVYGRGAALLLALDEFLPGGTDAFLKAYVQAFSFGYVTRARFEAFLNRYSGLDAGPLLLDYLDTVM